MRTRRRGAQGCPAAALLLWAPLGSRAQCAALSTCTDQAPFGMGDCKTWIPGGFYCADAATYGNDCAACSCKPGCEGDAGDGTPQNWRPGKDNPLGAGSGANGRRALSAAQQQALVDRHNAVRAYHGACPLAWSDAIAQNVADNGLSSWASSCQLQHTSSNTVAGFSSIGENLASASSMYFANNFPVDLKTMAWYLEEYDYDYGNPGSAKPGGGQIGHFTQVVWKDTTHVGCQMYQCDYQYGKKVLLACQYGPAGNYGGQYGVQVGARGEAAVGCAGGPPPAAPAPAPSASPRLPPSAQPSASPALPPSAGPTAPPYTAAAPSAPPVAPQPVPPGAPPSASPAPPADAPTAGPVQAPSRPPAAAQPPTAGPSPVPTRRPTREPLGPGEARGAANESSNSSDSDFWCVPWDHDDDWYTCWTLWAVVGIVLLLIAAAAACVWKRRQKPKGPLFSVLCALDKKTLPMLAELEPVPPPSAAPQAAPRPQPQQSQIPSARRLNSTSEGVDALFGGLNQAG